MQRAGEAGQGEPDLESGRDAVVLSQAGKIVPEPGKAAGTGSAADGRAGLNPSDASCCASPGFIESCLDFTVFAPQSASPC